MELPPGRVSIQLRRGYSQRLERRPDSRRIRYMIACWHFRSLAFRLLCRLPPIDGNSLYVTSNIGERLRIIVAKVDFLLSGKIYASLSSQVFLTFQPRCFRSRARGCEKSVIEIRYRDARQWKLHVRQNGDEK